MTTVLVILGVVAAVITGAVTIMKLVAPTNKYLPYAEEAEQVVEKAEQYLAPAAPATPVATPATK